MNKEYICKNDSKIFTFKWWMMYGCSTKKGLTPTVSNDIGWICPLNFTVSAFPVYNFNFPSRQIVNTLICFFTVLYYV